MVGGGGGGCGCGGGCVGGGGDGCVGDVDVGGGCGGSGVGVAAVFAVAALLFWLLRCCCGLCDAILLFFSSLPFRHHRVRSEVISV